MKVDFICKDENNSRLILVFAGWSAGAEVAKDIKIHGWDVAAVYDYSDLNLDRTFLDKYYTIYLFAWSLGVFAASISLPSDRITSAFAINGTLKPVDDMLGIPEAIYRGTADSLSPRNLKKFHRRMLRDNATWNQYIEEHRDTYSDDSVVNLKNQLNLIRESSAISYHDNLPWVRAYIGSNDLIFPPENMQRFWREYQDVEIILTADYHAVDISEIVKGVIADTSMVAAKFSKAGISYDTHAIAQYSAAIKLSNMLREMHPLKEGDILEIGCGTGLFTHEYAPLLKPRKATFVDISEITKFNIFPEEEYFCEDAERWIERQDSEWDTILSTSAIQWFADIPKFLKECHRILRPGGVIAISTFLPGNLEELDALRPSPLIYPKAEMLRKVVEELFRDVRVVEDEIKVEFKSAREVLMHLKHTGVGGSAKSSGLTLSDMSHLRTLTYRPVYLTARKNK